MRFTDFFNPHNRIQDTARRNQELEDFHFPIDLQYQELQHTYNRSALAQAVVDRFADGVFQSNPEIIDGDNEDDVHDQTLFETSLKTIIAETSLWNILKMAYAKNRIGNYSTLYLVFDDGLDPSLPVRRGAKLVKIQAFNQIQLKPYALNNQIGDVRRGEVEMFIFDDKPDENFDPSSNVNVSREAQHVHCSRVIVIAEGADSGDYKGVSAIARAYNGIKTYDRIIGSSGRGFLNASRGALRLSSPSGTEFDPQKLAKAMGCELDELQDALEAQIADFNAGYDKMLLTGNLQVEEFNFNLPDPEQFAQVALNSVAASCGCPSELLIGSQLSQKSGDGNISTFNKTLMSIRMNCINSVISVLVQRLIDNGTIPSPSSGTFRVWWDDLMASSDTDKMDLASKMAAINKSSVDAGQEPPFSPDEIRALCGFEPVDDIDLGQD